MLFRSGFATPTMSDAPFGIVEYTGIGGKVALYMPTKVPTDETAYMTIILSNISVQDNCGRPVDFLFFVADDETTNGAENYTSEQWSVTNPNGTWALVDTIPSIA